MRDDVDSLYLDWLYDHSGLYRRGRTRTYYKLLRHMNSKEFVWLPMRDKSRAEDGKELRWQFISDAGIPKVPATWLYRPCSVLEMMIGLSRRIATQTDGEPPAWFIQLLHNLHMEPYSDAHYDGHISDVEERLESLVWRTYRKNGDGGLFPLNRPRGDQRQVEIWYQMHAWLLERN